MKKLILICTLLLLMAGCGGYEETFRNETLLSWHNDTWNITCFQRKDTYRTLSCIPDWMLDPPRTNDVVTGILESDEWDLEHSPIRLINCDRDGSSWFFVTDELLETLKVHAGKRVALSCMSNYAQDAYICESMTLLPACE